MEGAESRFMEEPEEESSEEEEEEELSPEEQGETRDSLSWPQIHLCFLSH